MKTATKIGIKGRIQRADWNNTDLKKILTNEKCICPAHPCNMNQTGRMVRRIQKFTSQHRNPALLKVSRLNDFLFGIEVVGQAHSTACRAACTTFS